MEFSSNGNSNRPHALCIPLPAQGHINPMLRLTKLLHASGFYIAFVHSEFNYEKLIESRDSALDVEDFQFEAFSDGLPQDNQKGILDLPLMAYSFPVHALKSFRELIQRVNSSPDSPPVSCVVSDLVMGFAYKGAQEFDIPAIVFCMLSSCGLLGYLKFEHLVENGYFPLKGFQIL